MNAISKKNTAGSYHWTINFPKGHFVPPVVCIISKVNFVICNDKNKDYKKIAEQHTNKKTKYFMEKLNNKKSLKEARLIFNQQTIRYI